MGLYIAKELSMSAFVNTERCAIQIGMHQGSRPKPSGMKEMSREFRTGLVWEPPYGDDLVSTAEKDELLL